MITFISCLFLHALISLLQVDIQQVHLPHHADEMMSQFLPKHSYTSLGPFDLVGLIRV